MMQMLVLTINDRRTQLVGSALGVSHDEEYEKFTDSGILYSTHSNGSDIYQGVAWGDTKRSPREGRTRVRCPQAGIHPSTQKV